MKLISVNLPQKTLDTIEDYVNKGFFPNRSEAIRQIIFSFTQKKMKIKCPDCEQDIRLTPMDLGRY